MSEETAQPEPEATPEPAAAEAVKIEAKSIADLMMQCVAALDRDGHHELSKMLQQSIEAIRIRMGRIAEAGMLAGNQRDRILSMAHAAERALAVGAPEQANRTALAILGQLPRSAVPKMNHPIMK